MRLAVTFGALADPIRSQLRAQGVKMTAATARVFQDRADAIGHLWIGGLLTDSQCEQARKKLLRQLLKYAARSAA